MDPKPMTSPDLSHEIILCQKSNLLGTLVSFVSLGSYLMLVWLGLYLNNMLAWVVIWFLSIFLFSSFFSLLHWSVHYSLFKSRILNSVVGRIFALLAFDVFSFYKYWHYAHHDQTNVEGDSEGFNITSLSDYVRSLFAYFFNPYLRFVHYYDALSLNKENHKKYVVPHVTELMFDTGVFTTWIVLLGYGTYLSPLFFSYAYFVPLILSLPLLFFLDLAEHYGTEREPRSQIYATRTIRGNSFTHWLTVNNNYHLEHHLYPDAPYYMVSKLKNSLKIEAPYEEKTYFAFHIKLLKKLVKEMSFK